MSEQGHVYAPTEYEGPVFETGCGKGCLTVPGRPCPHGDIAKYAACDVPTCKEGSKTTDSEWWCGMPHLCDEHYNEAANFAAGGE